MGVSRTAWLCGLAVALLTACATTPAPQPRIDRSDAWLRHFTAIRDISNFVIDGRLSEGAIGSATLFWRQEGSRFSARASGPFGSGAIALAGTPDQVTIRTGEETITTRQPERWMRERLGWQLPVAGLRFWAVGRPMPGTPAHYAFTDDGRLAVLEQSGWQVIYESYEEQDQWWLPTRIRLVMGEQSVLLRIARWRGIEQNAQ